MFLNFPETVADGISNIDDILDIGVSTMQDVDLQVTCCNKVNWFAQ